MIVLNTLRKKQDLLSPFNTVITDNKVEEHTNNIQGALTIEKILPEESYLETWDTYVAILVFFSEPIEKESVKLRVTPNTPLAVFKTKEEDNFIKIVPKDGWYEGVNYSIEIVNATSTHGKILDHVYTKNLKIKRLETPAVY